MFPLQAVHLPKQYRFSGNKVAAELAFWVAKTGSARNRQALGMFLAPWRSFRLMSRPSGPMANSALTLSAAVPRLARSTR